MELYATTIHFYISVSVTLYLLDRRLSGAGGPFLVYVSKLCQCHQYFSAFSLVALGAGRNVCTRCAGARTHTTGFRGENKRTTFINHFCLIFVKNSSTTKGTRGLTGPKIEH